jgi:hypothetical protein
MKRIKKSWVLLETWLYQILWKQNTIFWDITLCSPLKVNWAGLCFKPDFMLVSCLAYSSTLKMEAMCTSETSVVFQRTTQFFITEDSSLHDHYCENLKSYIYENSLKKNEMGYTDTSILLICVREKHCTGGMWIM